MGEQEPTTRDARPSPPGEAPAAAEQPTLADEGPSDGGPRFALPAIAWARTATTSVKIGIVVLVASVVLGGAAFAAASLYSQYGAARNTPNALAWGGLTPRFAGATICASCHAPEAGAQDASIHVGVSCEDCHGPLAAHSASEAAAREPLPGRPESEVCVTCHAAVAGRPAAFPQVDLTRHYVGDECLRCHDPHSVVAVRPPTVSHPLANLPECTTCHSPDGLKKIPTGHEIVRDTICLSCHGRTANSKS
jgi:hypothetical protein